MLGRFLAGVLGQSLNSAGVLDYRQLNYFTLCSVSAATAVSFLLPSVEKTRYFHSGREHLEGVGVQGGGEEDSAAMLGAGRETGEETASGGCSRVMAEIKKDFVSAYR